MASKSTKSKPSHFYSSISLAIVMFLLGMFTIILLHNNDLTNLIKEKMNIVAELSEDSNKDDALSTVRSIEQIRANTIKFIPREEALETMRRNLQMNFEDTNNPFRDVITFNIKAKDYSAKSLEGIKSQLEKHPSIEAVYYEDLTIGNIKSNLNKIAYTILIIGLIFVFLAVIIIQNTINLSMYADRWEIKTMELVGARWNFIKMPYIKTSVLVGVKAFLLAAVLITAVVSLIYVKFPQLWEIINILYVAMSLGAIFGLSIIIPALSTNAATNKYLNKTINAMYD